MNLEKVLIKANRRLIDADELLEVREYERLGELTEDTTLQRLGLNTAATTGKHVLTRVDRLRSETQGFNQERVFHISQIEKVCKRYRLKFLNIRYYRGGVDPQLPSRITNFETAYGVKTCQDNCYIAAPRGSFELERRPKDPLFFYRINDDWFYLIHKWGRDLNPLRMLAIPFEHPVFCAALLVVAAFFVPLGIGLWANATTVGLATGMTLGFVGLLVMIIQLDVSWSDGDWERPMRFAPPNRWNENVR
jgi:hypothetical protein